VLARRFNGAAESNRRIPGQSAQRVLCSSCFNGAAESNRRIQWPGLAQGMRDEVLQWGRRE